MCSEQGKLTVSLIPPDYFFPAAIEKFIFFLRNGHADNMKEAVKLYDEYIHRENMEIEARKTRQSAEEAAYAEQQSAQQSMAANSMMKENQNILKEIAQKEESIAFWTMYNAYLNEERINH